MISILELTKFSVACLTAASLAVLSLGDESKDFNLPDLSQNVMDYLDSLPTSLNASDLPSIDVGEQQIKEMCIFKGLNAFFENYLAVRNKTGGCLKGISNYAELIEEINAAMPDGRLQDVTEEYCKKLPTYKGCILDLATAVEPCLGVSYKAYKKTVQNITDASLDFICDRKGDGIALFIAEDGRECISAKNEAIKSCFNSTFGTNTLFDFGVETVLSLYKLEPQKCEDIFKFQKCVVEELQTCPNPTAANMVESLIDHVLKETPCGCLNPRTEKRRPGCRSPRDA